MHSGPSVMRRVTLSLGLAALASLASAQTPSPALLVLNKTDNSLAVVDPKSNKVVGRVPTGDGPHEVVASADGALAFVSNYGTAQNPGTTLSVIDLATLKELRRFEVRPLGRPHGLAFADGKLYFTAEANRLIARYDPSNNQVDWMMGTGQTSTHMVVVSKDTNRIFTANIGSDTVSVFERGQNLMAWSATVIPVGKGPEGIEISPDGKEVWTAHSRDGGLSIIDVATKKVVQTLDVHTKRSNRVKLTPDGRLALVSDLDGGELVVIDAAARKPIKRLALGRMPEGILVAPDGTRAYVALNGDDHVAIIDLKTLEPTGRIATGAGPDGLAWAERK